MCLMNIPLSLSRWIEILQEKKQMGVSIMRGKYRRTFYEPWENIVRKIWTAQENRNIQYLYHPANTLAIEEALRRNNWPILLHGLFQEESILQEWLDSIMGVPRIRPKQEELNSIISKHGFCSQVLINWWKSIRQWSDLILLRPKTGIDGWKESEIKKHIWENIEQIYLWKGRNWTLEVWVLQYLWFGKRVRPWIFYELTRGSKLPPELREKIMVMIELIQSTTLIIDDIVDGHSFRDSEARPTLSSKFWAWKSTMISHDLMIFAEEIILELKNELWIWLVNKMLEIKNHITTDLANWQWADMWHVNNISGDRWVHWCFEEVYKKTYSLIQFPFILAGLFTDKPESQNYPEIGKKLWIIYQLMDDLQELDKEDVPNASCDFCVAYLLDKNNLPQEEKKLLLSAIRKKQKHKIAKDADLIIKNLCWKYSQEIKESGLEYASEIYKEMVSLYPEGFRIANDIEGMFLMLVGAGYWAYQKI